MNVLMDFIKHIFGIKKKKFQEALILLEETSPCCPITAIVEQDNRVAYLYLYGPEGNSFGVKSCWIRNLDKAPRKVESKLLEKGIPPMMPLDNCLSPSGLEPLKKGDLSIIWLEEGDGAALLENGMPIAIIPSWSGRGGFYGYSKEAKGQGAFAWELNTSKELFQRIKDAQDFWASWNNEINPFQIEQPKLLDVYKEFFGNSEKYFAIDGEEGPPRGLFIVDSKEKTIFATVGLSLFPMPQVEIYTENRLELNRLELGLMLDSKHCKSNIQSIAEWFSGICSIPWGNITFLGEGHTILFDAFNHPKFKSVLLTQKVSSIPKIELENYKNSVVNFLWLIPVTEKERQFAMDNGSEKLINKLNNIGKEIFSLDREEIM